MLFYYKYQTSLDIFSRSNISEMFKDIISEMNIETLPYYFAYRRNISLKSNNNNRSYYKSKRLIVDLDLYHDLNGFLYSNHFNPYMHTFEKNKGV